MGEFRLINWIRLYISPSPISDPEIFAIDTLILNMVLAHPYTRVNMIANVSGQTTIITSSQNNCHKNHLLIQEISSISRRHLLFVYIQRCKTSACHYQKAFRAFVYLSAHVHVWLKGTGDWLWTCGNVAEDVAYELYETSIPREDGILHFLPLILSSVH